MVVRRIKIKSAAEYKWAMPELCFSLLPLERGAPKGRRLAWGFPLPRPTPCPSGVPLPEEGDRSSLVSAFKLLVQRSCHIKFDPVSLNPLLFLDLHDLFHRNFFFVEGFAGDRTVQSHVRELP